MLKGIRCVRFAVPLALGAAFILGGRASAQAPAPGPQIGVKPDDGIEIQERGPVHEAFARPYDKNVTPAAVVPKKPPAPIPEEPPEQKPAVGSGESLEWIPGYWAWDADRSDFIWVSGFWRVPPPGRKWLPGHWTQTGNGWQWVSGLWQAANRDLQYLPEPPPSVENGPSVPAPNDNSIYIPGAWQYQNDAYLWRPGYWYPGYADWVWNPAYYSWTPNGAAYVSGYWDYPFANRGLLFAPAYFNRPLWANAGWCYRPSFAVDVGNLWGSLFIGPYCNHYFFGDYYSPFYARTGFWPWYSWGRHGYDPLFNHYGWAHRGDPGWYAGLRNTYWGRRNGDLVRPGSALAAANGIRPAGNVPHLVAPLNRLPNGSTSLNRVSPAQLQQYQANTQHFRDLSNQRNRTEVPGRRPAPAALSRQSGYSGLTINNGRSGPVINNGHSGPVIRNGGGVHNATPFREQATVRSSAPQAYHAAAAHYSAPAYRGSSHVMPSHSRSAPAMHGGGGHGGGGHGGGHGSKH